MSYTINVRFTVNARDGKSALSKVMRSLYSGRAHYDGVEVFPEVVGNGKTHCFGPQHLSQAGEKAFNGISEAGKFLRFKAPKRYTPIDEVVRDLRETADKMERGFR